MASTSAAFNDLPNKALISIFQNIDQTSRQKLRTVCHFWKRFIEEEFPVELSITQDNYQRLFRCPNAVKVEIQNLTTEYFGDVWFGSSVRSMLFTGKVLSSNIFSILRYCPELQILRFSALKQVLGIQGTESIKLPKATTLEIHIRPDQETFTADEIIMINVLRQIIFGSLNTILINTRSFLETWEDEEDEGDNMSQLYDDSDGPTRNFTLGSLSPMSSLGFQPGSISVQGSAIPYGNPQGHPFNQITIEEVESITERSEEPQQILPENILEPQPAPTAVVQEPSSNELGTQTTNTNLHVIINRGMNYEEDSAASSQASSSASTRRVRRNISEFEARLFYANLEYLVDSRRVRTELSILNESISQATIQSAAYFEIPETTSPVVQHTSLFELIRNNSTTMKNLYVKARTDFTCFGNLSSFSKDLMKVQFEDVDYSFGRMQVCAEHGLLQAQTHLKKIRLQIFDDMWKHLMTAVSQSQATLQDLDVKVMSMNEDRVDVSPIVACSNLKTLKLLHFFEKESSYALPLSVTKLVLNGPVSYKDMETWTKELVDLEEFTLLLNQRGGKIDLQLYKKFLKMPKLNKLTLIQCPTELDNIQKYIDETLKTSGGTQQSKINNNGFKFMIHGPREIKDIPFVQYIYTIIDPQKFNREQVVIEEINS